MHPINKKYFGNGANSLSVQFHNGTAVTQGYIVKQLGTSRFRVTDGTVTRDVVLMPDITDLNDLTDGFATIECYQNGVKKFVRTIQSQMLRTTDDTSISWHTNGVINGSILYDPTATGNGILGWMGRSGTWQDTANGIPVQWNDDEVWDDGVSDNFNPVLMNSTSAGTICGSITPLPDGGAVTYTLANTFGGMFAISGANVVIGTTPVVAGTYNLVANAVNVSGWTWSVPCTVVIA